MARKDAGSDHQAPRGLERPPAHAVVESDNILGADGSKSDVSKEAEKASGSEPGNRENPPPKPKRDRRIPRLNRRARQAEEALEEERRRSAELEAELERVRAGAVEKKPVFKDFESEEEYAEAYSEWKAAQTPKRPKPRNKNQGPPQADVEAFLDAGAETPGWETAMDRAKANKFPLNASMLEYLLDSDKGHAMFVALSKKPDIAREIAGEKGYAALELLQELEEEVSVKKEKKVEKKPPPPGPSRLQSDASSSETSSFDSVPKMDSQGRAKAADLRNFMQRRRKEHNETFGF